KDKFGDGSCDRDCMEPECLRDGFDCLKDRGHCSGHTEYCRAYFSSGRCDQGCNNAACGWDGSDCFKDQAPVWADGSLLLHTKIPKQNVSVSVSPLLWTLSVLLQSPLKLRGFVGLAASRNLFDFSPQDLAELLAHSSTADSDSLLFLQVDNRPCSRSPSTCFPSATEAGSFLQAVLLLKPPTFPALPELKAIISIRGVREEIGSRESNDSVRVRHRPKVPNDEEDSKTKAWMQHTAHQERVKSCREKDKISLRKKKKAKEAEKKRRREPLGEDAIRMPLRRDQDAGSDTDFTQSSMEDVNMRCSRRQEEASICDHRSPEQRHPPRGWERNAMPPPAEWCGPDGSVVLIRAVRSGLDRVVLELLQAGVPVNNTDHTRSALHWACSVNHLSLARTLIRYGAAVDLQDNKGETALFLAALHGCYDTARLLLLHGANLELHDRRGRRPTDVAREAMHHQVLELLLAHQMQRRPVPVPVPPVNDMTWEEHALMYSTWVGSQGLHGRSASFSGIVGHRDMSPQPQDWSMARVQYSSPQNWRPQLNQSATALVPPRIMGRPPRPISTLQEVTSEDEDRDRNQEVPRATTPHFLSPQPAPRQRSFSCTQHALQRRSSSHQPEPNYLIVTDRMAGEPIER
uniref:Notch receptor, like n=1 Tax=Kryptolebias marmoratus TaxID=37003 RepID=A0A3Q3G7A0_KRYMA